MISYHKHGVKHGITALCNRLSDPLSLTQLFLLFWVFDFPYQYGFRYLEIFASLNISIIEAAIFTCLLWITTRLDLARVTLCFLALPYLIFFSGWLNAPTAIVLLIIFIYCITQTLRATTSIRYASIHLHDFFAFCLVIVWVNLSGAGGYGHQSPDYDIHNARLYDLINKSWPVHYGDNQNFVSYFGYFLPSAVIGKLSAIDMAFQSLYCWTILGAALALRWLSFLSGWRYSILLAMLFILFGPLDSLNVLLLDQHSDVTPNNTTNIWLNSDYLDFRSRYDLGFFIGNYLSNTFQLFWSPHQIIAGWLGMSLLSYLFLKKQTTQILFVYTLLCLWSPLIMIALFPLMFIMMVTSLFDKTWRQWMTFENTLGSGILTLLFVLFYLGGSPEAIPSYFVLDLFDWKNKGWVLALFYFSAWGALALIQIPFMLKQPLHQRVLFLALISALFLLPLKTFGAYSDLLCRGSAPLMFLLLVFVLQSIRHYSQKKHYVLLGLLSGLLVLGSGSSLLQLRTALHEYDKKAVVLNIVNYSYAAENLGPDHTFFNHYFRHGLRSTKSP